MHQIEKEPVNFKHALKTRSSAVFAPFFSWPKQELVTQIDFVLLWECVISKRVKKNNERCLINELRMHYGSYILKELCIRNQQTPWQLATYHQRCQNISWRLFDRVFCTGIIISDTSLIPLHWKYITAKWEGGVTCLVWERQQPPAMSKHLVTSISQLFPWQPYTRNQLEMTFNTFPAITQLPRLPSLK